MEEEEKIAAYIKEKADKQAELEAEQKYFFIYLDVSRNRKKKKSKNSENFKKRLQTGRLNWMPSEPKGLLRPMKELPERRIELRLKSEQRELKNFSKQDLNSSWRRKDDWKRLQKLRRLSSKLQSGSRES